MVEAFIAGRGGALGVVANVQGDALERWLRYAFGVPDRFADALLLARFDDAGAVEVAAALRFLRDAEVDVRGASEAPLAELMWDRRALLEKVSPWRWFEQSDAWQAGLAAFMGVLAGARAWRGRYRIAYAAHYHAVRREAAETVRAALEQQRARLASRAAHLVLAREEVPALDRLLQVIAASDFGGLERVLDTRLAEHIEALLREPVAMR